LKQILMLDETTRRKDSHLDLCAKGEVEPAGSDALFGDVHLIHESLPELCEADIDLSCSFLGKRLRLPLLITGMTGGTERGRELNLGLARIAEELGIGFCVGSQRAMLERPETASSYQVRAVAPRAALVGNIGLWQARALGSDAVRRLMDAIEADGIAVHLNVAQELVQPEGDRDFRAGLETIARLASALGERLVVKETGCGISPSVAQRLVDAGVRNIDVSGVGGTSWIQVEALRSTGSERSRGELFASWGIPTAVSVNAVAQRIGERATIIASGGIRDGLMAAKALALGADLVGVALPALRAWEAGGEAAARAFLEELASGLRLAMALTGSWTVAELRSRPVVTSERFRSWTSSLAAASVAVANR
jgi:isopentenyl-diphosphate delta-isomerase